MKRLFLLILAFTALFMVGCNDDLSPIGESIQPGSDPVSAKVDTLEFSVKTIEMGDIYNRTNFTLLGDITDPEYGDLKADYIMQLKSPRNFKFKYQPINGRIDSVKLSINYDAWVGDSTALMKVSVYKINKAIPESHYTTQELASLLDETQIIASQAFRAGNDSAFHRVRVPLPKDIGQKIYDLSVNNPSVFDTQESFYNNVFGGLYITTTTGTGVVLNVYNTQMAVYYTYRVTADSTQTATETFVNTSESYQVNHVKNSQIAHLLVPNDSLACVKSPAGVMTQLTISKEQFTDAYTSTLSSNLAWQIGEAQFNVTAEKPAEGLVLSPPPYLLLLPQDSVKSFFEEEQTELSQPKTAFLSSTYNISSREYKFSNISRLLMEHIKNNTEKDANGKPYISKDLVLVLLPVKRQLGGSGSTAYTIRLNNFLFPAGVKLKLGTKDKTARIGVYSMTYTDN
ncbi:DUF4270 domain-containing protein [Porphyromonas loveana]|uniref:Uncharacterized protein DUF4270 n=2 Tax=Bacteroidales TaxID=171549 RepID=A0A2U1FHM7_9PORP|nr:DUF4270 domain-containing protein [Porphyromonas loveana]PVZ11669.1 uncharacterized protein DUF4270 [Porphyromonas loveana]